VPASALPAAQPGEGGFAASGLCVETRPGGLAWIAAGNATRARVFRSTDWGRSWSAADAPVFAVGLIAAFVSAFICVRWLIRYIATHDFTIFAWYRIVAGVLLLLATGMGWL
jgi:undecaprenyl pyrophosphate phosphatase UppP